MSSNQYHIATAFNKAAATYSKNCAIQNQSGLMLINELVDIQSAFTTVIDLGCGTGITTSALASAIRYENFSALDISEQLICVAELPTDIKRIHDNFDNITNHNILYSLIFSNLALHWSPDLAASLYQIHQSLAPDGLLAFSIPLQNTFVELKDKFSTQNFITLERIQSILHQSGYRILTSHQQTFTQDFSDALSALRSIKLTGTNYVARRKHSGLHAPSFLRGLTFTQLTYHLGFFIAGKHHD